MADHSLQSGRLTELLSQITSSGVVGPRDLIFGSQDGLCYETWMTGGRQNIFLASREGHWPLLKKFKDCGADLGSFYEDCIKWSPLVTAAEHGRWEAVQFLVSAQVPLDQKSEEGKTAVCAAAQNNHHNLALFLISKGASYGFPEKFPLLGAVEEGHIEMAQKLLALGHPVNEQNSYGLCPLMGAINHKGPKGQEHEVMLVKLLLAAGASVDVVDSAGISPLMLAVSKGKGRVGRVLLAAGANVNHTAHDGSGALEAAAARGSGPLLRMLLAAGAPPTPRALAAALGGRSKRALCLLLKADRPVAGRPSLLDAPWRASPPSTARPAAGTWAW